MRDDKDCSYYQLEGGTKSFGRVYAGSYRLQGGFFEGSEEVADSKRSFWPATYRGQTLVSGSAGVGWHLLPK